MAAVYITQWYFELSLFPSNTYLDSVLDAAVSLGLSVAILAFLTTAIVAVPGLYLLFRTGDLSPLRVIALGALAGQAPFMLIALVVVVTQLVQGRPLADASQAWHGTFGMVRAVGLGAWLGSTSAATFWFVALWRSPIVTRTRPEG